MLFASRCFQFGFLDCSKCKQQMSHPSREIRAVLDPVVALKEEVEAKALARLKIEKMENDAKLVTKGSQFYGKPTQYAMASFAYYNCFKCKVSSTDMGSASDRLRG